MLDWSRFEALSGSAQRNFEMLCRSLVRLRYGRYGQLAGFANQPGVEFHLRLHEDCDLGAKGQWFGWQCRWYNLLSGRALGSARRKKIEDALKKTSKVLPRLTDWILCTRFPLTAGDQKWFFGLGKKMHLKMRLALWHSEDIETFLSGEAAILRRTYFGDLALTNNELSRQHQISVARIGERWLPEAHQPVEAERALRRMLGEAGSWDELSVVARRLLGCLALIRGEASPLNERLTASIQPFLTAGQMVSEALKDIHLLLQAGDFDLLRQRLGERPCTVSPCAEAAPRQLRSARLACGLHATNALADMKNGIRLLNEVGTLLGTRLVGVVADAGGGKTQLAAQLTDALPDRAAGILLHGRELHSGRTLDDLAKSICIGGKPVASMEALLAALDSAGQRHGRRLPLVIDGVNEADDPREWKAPLAELEVQLNRFASVLVVCTVRTGARRPVHPEWPPQPVDEPSARLDFAKQALPEGIQQIEIPGFGGDTVTAIRRYFAYFKINPGDAEMPVELFSHPLTLRIFCEVTNRDRIREAIIQTMPGSLTGLFERYTEDAIARIAELAPRTHRYFEHDVRQALDVLGWEFWQQRARAVSQQELRSAIHDDARPWDQSVIHMLEQEGVILRTPGESPGKEDVIPVYDPLGGYLIANAMLTKLGRAGLESWLKDSGTLEAMTGNVANCHPLAVDTLRALVGLVPARLHRQQLWELVDEPLRGVALQMAAELEAKYLDATTVQALADVLREAKPGSGQVFVRLFFTRGVPDHPLNADFLDGVLRSMAVGDRDRHWTEWVRRHRKVIQNDVQQLEERWRRTLTPRMRSDQLRAKWVMWLLTTTVRNLRDRATRALYWLGRGDPKALFEQAAGAAEINDPYVLERTLAASYGVAMALQCNPCRPDARKTIVPEHARRIFDLLFKPAATCRTTHVLIREYGRRFIELTLCHKQRLISVEELDRVRPPYSDGGRIAWQAIESSGEEVHSPDSPFRMDFENYTLGHLAEGRTAYDFNHLGYRKIRAQVLWRVGRLGWSAEKFGQIDRTIESERYCYSRVVDEPQKVDRYGKKYSWIAYFELGGWLRDQGLLTGREDHGRTWDVDIDPSFPEPTPEQRIVCADLLCDQSLSLTGWIKTGPTPDLKPYLRQASILGESGPWVMLDGFVSQEDESRGRRLFAFVRSFLIAQREAKAFAAWLAKQPLGGRWLPEKPEVTYTFAGEVPWCETFPKTEKVELAFVVRERRVTVKRRQPFLVLDGKEISLSLTDLARFRVFGVSLEPQAGRTVLTEEDLARVVRRYRLVEAEEIQQEFRRFRAVIPVYDVTWEGLNLDGVPIHGVTLAKGLARSAGLVHLPQTHDLQTKDGVRASYGRTFRPQDYPNTEHFFFVREGILRALLRKHRWALVYAVWGERELSSKQMERALPGGDLAGLSHGDFQAVYRFR